MTRDDQTPRQSGHDPLLAPLDPLGDCDLALTGQQRDATHLAQVGAHQILALVRLLARGVDL